MEIDRRNPPSMSPPTGLYSIVSVAPPDGKLGVVSGQTGRRPNGSIASTAGEQATEALANIETALRTQRSGFCDVLVLRWLVVGSENAAAVRAARDQFLAAALDGAAPPSSTLALVGGLADERAQVEVEAWFVAPPEQGTLPKPPGSDPV